MGEYVTKLRRAGVPIVAGTDGYGMELVRELELYVDGGMTPGRGAGDRDHRAGPQRQGRTTAPARSPSARKPICCWSTATPKRIGDLRHVDQVMSDGC